MKTMTLLVAGLCLALSACRHSNQQQPEPMEPDSSSPERVPEPEESADDVFVREFDDCWNKYKECLKTNSDRVCFPPHEACAVAAYRKLMAARDKNHKDQDDGR